MDIGRVIATAIIWAGCLGVVLANIITGGNMFLTMFALFMGVVGMIPVWENQKPPSSSSRFGSSPLDLPKNTKLKREDVYDQETRLLLELMDDDERQAFKQTLKDKIINRHNRLADGLVDGELPFDADEYDYFEPDERQNR